MMKLTATIALFTVLILSGCSDNTNEPETGSESHWLDCETDDECPGERQCIANRCEPEEDDASEAADPVEARFIAGGWDRLAIQGQADPPACVYVRLVWPPEGGRDLDGVDLELPDGWALEAAGAYTGECVEDGDQPTGTPAESISGAISFEWNEWFEDFSVNLEITFPDSASNAPRTARLVAEDVQVR